MTCLTNQLMKMPSFDKMLLRCNKFIFLSGTTCSGWSHRAFGSNSNEIHQGTTLIRNIKLQKIEGYIDKLKMMATSAGKRQSGCLTCKVASIGAWSSHRIPGMVAIIKSPLPTIKSHFPLLGVGTWMSRFAESCFCSSGSAHTAL